MSAVLLKFRRSAPPTHPPTLLLFDGDGNLSGSVLKAFRAGGWVLGTSKYWDGTAWVAAPLRVNTVGGWV